MRIAVVGAAGFVGGELLRILLQHPKVNEVVPSSRSQAGISVADVHPQLHHHAGLRFSDKAPEALASECDAIFCALEHGASSTLMPSLIAAGAKCIVDLGADFRVADMPLYERFYGKHPHPDLCSSFTYALADVLGTKLRGSTRIAAPGCFATAASLALYPLRKHQGLQPALFGITGSSGAGITPRSTTHHPLRAHNLFAYNVFEHRHEAEILQNWRAWTGDTSASARLMVHAGPFVRGIHLTLHARGEDLDAHAYTDAYANRPFVRITKAPPELTHVQGSNYAHLHAKTNADKTELVAMVVIDNLVKGAGGQAVQAWNLAQGFSESLGLDTCGFFPC